MKKTISLLSFLFVSIFLNAQSRINVEYNQIFNTDFPLIRTGVLQIDGNHSVFVDIMKSKRNLKKDNDINASYLDFIKEEKSTEIKEGEQIVLQVGGNYDSYYLYNQTDGSFLFTEELGTEQILIKDFFELKWDITKETKSISGHQCYKAVTDFRGRSWEAWFAPDLAFGFGLWKLHGLPGLILEAYDSTFRYHFVALKVYKSDGVLQPEIKSLKQIDFKNFILHNFEIIDNSLNIINRDVEVIKHNVKRNGRETVFEWE